MRLPDIKYTVKKSRTQQVFMKGINYSDATADGELKDSLNLSTRRFPYISTRRHRAKQDGYSDVTALASWEKLVAVSGTDLLYDGVPVGKVSAGEKQFAVVNNKIIVYPDKVYLDLQDMQVKPMDIDVDAHKIAFTTDTVSGYFGTAVEFPKVGLLRVSSGATNGDVIAVGDTVLGSGTEIKFDGFKVFLKRQSGGEYVDDDWSEVLSEGDKVVLFFWGLNNGVNTSEAAYIRQWEVVRAGLGYITFKTDPHFPAYYSAWRTGSIQIWTPADDSLIDIIAYKEKIYRIQASSTTYDKYYETIRGDEEWPGLGDSHVRIKREEAVGHNNEILSDTYVGASENLSDILKNVDTIKIEGCETYTDNNKAVSVVSLTENSITTTANAFEAGSEDHIKIVRKAPDFDFICASENRLWGCNSEEQTIYASALGDPLNFITFEGISMDAYALAVATPGDFTGCCALGSSVLFWKEDSLHKILGSYPAEYTLYTYNMEGVKAGCHKSIQIINDTLYYLGNHGVFAYSGGYPSLISPQFGQRVFKDAISGNDGDTYYLSVLEGTTPLLLAFETRYGLWLCEDDLRAADFTRIGKDLYCADSDGNVWLMDDGTEDPDIDWIAQFAPVYETIEGRKVFSKILLRLQVPKGSYVIAETRIDGGRWEETGRVAGSEEDVVPMRITFNRCDKFELKLYGHGPAAILSILREYSVGSDM